MAPVLLQSHISPELFSDIVGNALSSSAASLSSTLPSSLSSIFSAVNEDETCQASDSLNVVWYGWSYYYYTYYYSTEPASTSSTPHWASACTCSRATLESWTALACLWAARFASVLLALNFTGVLAWAQLRIRALYDWVGHLYAGARADFRD
eukprot:1975505-Amphidinium_carterae.1